jgi:MULE transposase domain
MLFQSPLHLSSEDKESFKWVLVRLPPPMTFVTDGDTKLIAAIRSLHPNFGHILCIRHVCKNLSYLPIESESFVPIPQALNMRLQGQRLTAFVNTKWEEMIRDWRAVMLKEQQCSYQSVENERTVTQHSHGPTSREHSREPNRCARDKRLGF